MAEVVFRDYLNEIDNLIEHGSLDQALQHCRHILTQYPKAVEVYRLLGKVLLEQEDDRAAQDVFQRVLSVDPEDFVARVGLSIIHDRNNELEPAIWHMERAFEIAPSNALIQGELRRLYARRDGDSPERIPLTRGALARLYAQGDLNSEAIVDLRQLLAEQTDRLDLQVQLAEVLWRDEQRLEAAEFTQRITGVLPYCLKANLILGAILRDSGANGESDEPFQHAQAVDPENEYAQRLFSGLGPLYPKAIMVDRLELQTIDQMLEAPLPLAETEEVPEWLRGLSDVEQPLLEEPESLGAERLAPGLHMPDVATEIPDWLQGLSGESGAAAEAEVPGWLAALTGVAAVGAAAEAITDHRREAEETGAAPAEEVVPDWITQLGQTGALTDEEQVPPVEEQPAWLAEMRETPPAPFSEQFPTEVDTETPDWLAQLRASSGAQETEEEAGLGLGAAAGLAGLAGAALYAAREQEEAVEPAPEPEQSIDFVPPAETPIAEAEPSVSSAFAEPQSQPEVPEEMPSADDALAFLSRLAAGKEDELRAQAQQDAEVRMAEIMGRKPAEAAPVVEEKESSGLAAGAALAGAGIAAGMAAAQKEEQPVELEASTPIPPAAEIPEEMPSADDALAFLAKLAAGKEDQLRAEAQQDAEVRMAEIMGRKPAEPKATESAAEAKTGPIKMTVPAATVAAVAAGLAAKKTTREEPPAKVESPAPPAAEVPEEMPSADDALAFLSRLAAGKEDELRAQAQQDAEVRMAEIMGRKPAEHKAPEPSREEEPKSGLAAAATVGAAALVTGIATSQPEEPAAAVPEEMPSADDALAFLAKLAAGKEDQLRAQAEKEAETRMAAIMGRSAPLESAEPVEVKPTSAAMVEPEAETADWVFEEETTEAAEHLAEADLPDWLRAMRPTEEGVVETPENELPDWLRAMRPSEEASEAGLVGLYEEEEEPLADTIEEEALPVTSLAAAAAALGLISDVRPAEAEAIEEETGAEQLLAELATPEQTPAHPEAISTPEPAPAVAPPQAASLLSPDWWVQTASDTDEEPLKGLPEPYLSPRARAAEKEKAAAAAATAAAVSKPVKPTTAKLADEPAAGRKLPQTGPLRQTGPLGPLPQTGPLGVTEAGAVPAEVEVLLSRVYQDRQDYAARLDLARTYWATGNREGAYTEYLELVTADQFTKETMADLETIVDIHDQSDWHRMLGDVYMRAGRLSSALQQYRRALNEV